MGNFQDEALCTSARFDKFRERSFKHGKIKRFQPPGDLGTAVINYHVLSNYNGITCKPARVIFRDGNQRADILF